MDRITRCELHDTTFITEEGSMFDRCFVCVFEENDRLKGEVKKLTAERDELLDEEKRLHIVINILESRLSAMEDVMEAGGKLRALVDRYFSAMEDLYNGLNDPETGKPLKPSEVPKQLVSKYDNALAKLEGREET